MQLLLMSENAQTSLSLISEKLNKKFYNKCNSN